jgi:hypothetical protein
LAVAAGAGFAAAADEDEAAELHPARTATETAETAIKVSFMTMGTRQGADRCTRLLPRCQLVTGALPPALGFAA